MNYHYYFKREDLKKFLTDKEIKDFKVFLKGYYKITLSDGEFWVSLTAEEAKKQNRAVFYFKGDILARLTENLRYAISESDAFYDGHPVIHY